MSKSIRRFYTSSDELLAASQNKALTYFEWLKHESSFDRENAFEQYTTYLNQWYLQKGVSSSANQTEYIRNLYINLLKQVALDYTTPEEKRFLKNINYEDNEDLDIALPFFAKKLKQIAIYYAGQRDEIKFSPIKANLKGSSYGIGQILYKQIADMLQSDPYIYNQLTDLNLQIEDVLQNLSVDVVELYDTEQNYYNISESANSSEYSNITTTRYNYFNLSVIPDRAKMFITETFNESIVELISQVPVILQSGDEETPTELRTDSGTSLGVTDIVTGTELDRLDDSQFINYNSTGELNITYEQLAFQKYIGANYYYLKTGDTLTDTVSGKLFTASAPHREILNRFHPTIAACKGENLYKEQYIGGFFNTTGIGLLNFTTLDHTYRFTPSLNTTHYFPDPEVGASGYYGTYTPFDTPVVYHENVNWHKQSVSSHYNYGLQRQFENISRFVPYQSAAESHHCSVDGVSRYDDAFDFWNTDGSNSWMNQDIFPLLQEYVQPIQSRSDQLLTGNKVVYNWKTDIYGNNYALLKTSIHPDYSTPVNTDTTRYDTHYNTHSVVPQSDITNPVTGKLHPSKNLTDQKSLSGTLVLRNNSNTGVQTLTSESLSGIYDKYSSAGSIDYRGTSIELTTIRDEILSNLLDFEIVYDIIIFETKNYTVFEKIMYDYDTGTVTSGQKSFSFIKKNYHGNKYEHQSNWWFDEPGGRILLAKSTVHPSASATAARMIYPEIHSYNLNNNELRRVYPDPDYNDAQLIYETQQYSLSASPDTQNIDIIETKPPVFTYNPDSERFSTSQLGYDHPENVYLLKTDFRLLDETVEFVDTSFYKNKYNTYSLNPHASTLSERYFSELNPSLTGDTWVHDSDTGTLYMSCTSVSGEEIEPVANSGCMFVYGSSAYSFSGERDIVMCFDYASSGTLVEPTLKPHGMSVIFYQTRIVDDLKLYKGGSYGDNFRSADSGGLGSAYGYYSDTIGTSTQPSLSGLDNAHCCVVLDSAGQIGTTPLSGENVAILGPYDDSTMYQDIVPLSGTDFTLYNSLSAGDDYSSLEYTRTRVTLTDCGRKVLVHMKNPNDQEFTLISSTNIKDFFPTTYNIPSRMNVALVSNTSEVNNGIIAIKNITVTGYTLR